MSKHLRVSGRLSDGAVCPLDDDAARHARVRGAAVAGARFAVVDDAGARWDVEVVDTRPIAIRVIASAAPLGADPEVALTVWVPLLKGGRTDDLVRQLVELGASCVGVWQGRRSVARLRTERDRDKRRARWERVAAAATSQCGRTVAPEIIAGASVADVGSGGVVFTVAPGEPARVALAAVDGPLSVLVGPEGGLAPDELEALRARGWRLAHLGPRVLRAETAVIAAATLALHALGEGGY